jgi:hypothetical protein
MRTKNPWKTATIILLIMAVGILAYDIVQEKSMNYNFNGVEVSKVSLDKITENILPGTAFSLCNAQTQKCEKIIKLK